MPRTRSSKPSEPQFPCSFRPDRRAGTLKDVTDGPLSRLVRALLLAAATVVLLGLVVVAAGGYRLGEAGSSHATPYAVDTLLTIVLAVYAVGALALIGGTFWAGLDVRRHPMPSPRRRSTFAAIALALGALALLVALSSRFHWRFGLDRIHPPPAASTSVGTSADATSKTKDLKGADHQPQFRIVPFVVVLGGAVAAFGALAVAEKRRRRRLPPDRALTDELVEALDETLDDLRAERDPRRAVIAAYARMERALAAHGMPRRRFEAPHEYLGRVLGELTNGRAPARLTALFERARFSTHAIDAPMKDEAIEALERLQAELAAAEAERAA
jgi:Domain of unknown function (DUF4129)